MLVLLIGAARTMLWGYGFFREETEKIPPIREIRVQKNFKSDSWEALFWGMSRIELR